MATPARNLWEELERQIQQWIKDIERRLNPPQPEPVRVPVPVRPNEDFDRMR